MRFDHVRLDPNWKIQTQGRLNTMIKRQYALGRVLVCASSLGLAKAAFDDMLYHAGSHRVKGELTWQLAPNAGKNC